MSCGGQRKLNANGQAIQTCVKDLKHVVEKRGEDPSLITDRLGRKVFHRLIQQKKREMGLGYNEGTDEQNREAQEWARNNLVRELEAEYEKLKAEAANPELVKERSADWKAKQEAEATAAAEAYIAGIESITTGEEFQRALAYGADIRDYSFGNCMMIAFQHMGRLRKSQEQGGNIPERLGLVMSRTNWEKKGRTKKAGEIGYNIIVPRIVKGSYYVDGTGRRVYLKKGQTAPPGATEKSGEAVVGYMIRETYASYQTEGDPIPTMPRPDIEKGDSYPGLKDALEKSITDIGYSIEYVDPTDDRLQGADGITYQIDKKIYVRNDRDPLERDGITAHEFGHAFLHGKDGEKHDHTLCRGEKEVEAEGVKFVLMHRLGIDTTGSAAKYSAGWWSTVKGTVDQRAKFFRSLFDRMGKGSDHVLKNLGV